MRKTLFRNTREEYGQVKIVYVICNFSLRPLHETFLARQGWGTILTSFPKLFQIQTQALLAIRQKYNWNTLLMLMLHFLRKVLFKKPDNS